MTGLRESQSAGMAARLLAAAGGHLRVLAGEAWRLAKPALRSFLQVLSRILHSLWIWIVTKSPLAEERRRGQRPLLSILPWVLVAFAWIALTIASVIAYYATVLPDPRQAVQMKLPPSLTILARGGEHIGERGMRRTYVPYKDISPLLIKAVLATEDHRFFYHFGLDPLGLLRAAGRNWRSGEVVQGGSTITQQLAKNLFLQPKRTWRRKAEEFILTLWLESRYSKQDILELYLTIMRHRLEDQLCVDVRVAPEVRNALTPHLLLQPLVENSIRHGMNPKSHAVTVAITAEREGSDTKVRVRDWGCGLPRNGIRRGTGISNTAERLQQLYGARHKLEFENCEDGGLLVTVTFPYRT